MIDMHAHILPNIDDGPDTLQESMQLAELLAVQKVTKVVCTPHFDPSCSSLEELIYRRGAAIARMKNAPIELIPASETRLHEYLFHYSDIGELCIKNTRYLLLELPYGVRWNTKFFDSLERLIDYYNIKPMIAHIERYPIVSHKDIKSLQELGCVIQMNTSSILAPESKKKALRYLKRNYIDVLGSDCHSLKLRPPCITQALDIIEDKLGAEYCERFDYHSKCIIAGADIRKKKSYIV